MELDRDERLDVYTRRRFVKWCTAMFLLGLGSCQNSIVPESADHQQVEHVYYPTLFESIDELLAFRDNTPDQTDGNIELRYNGVFTLSDSIAKALNFLGCSTLWLRVDTIILDVEHIPMERLSNLNIVADELTSLHPISLSFPRLRLINITMSDPFTSNIFEQGIRINTLMLNGRFSSTRHLINTACSGGQLILDSPILTSVDSLILKELNFYIVNVQGTPLSDRLDSLFPRPEDCYDVLEMKDSTTLVFGP